MSDLPSFAQGRARLKAKLRTAFAALSVWCGGVFLWQHLFAYRGVRILAYHGVETPVESPFSVSAENFEAQIAYLKQNYQIIDLATFRRWQAGQFSSQAPMVVLTFDDGFRNNLTVAAPILRKYGAPAAFFVIGAKLDGSDGRFMNAADLRSLHQAGPFEIGSHTFNHLSVARLSPDLRKIEIDGSRTAIEKQIGVPVASFCYPYGTFNDFDRDSADSIRHSGYALALTAVNGVNFRSTDPFRLRRTKVEWSDDMATFKRLLAGGMDGWILIDYFLRFLQRPRAVRFDREKLQGT